MELKESFVEASVVPIYFEESRTELLMIVHLPVISCPEQLLESIYCTSANLMKRRASGLSSRKGLIALHPV